MLNIDVDSSHTFVKYKIDSDELITEVLLAWNKEKVTDEIKEFLEFLFNQFD